jgi:hypothetical protein
VQTFNVEIARQRSLLATLVFTVLSNAVDTEGDLPDEMTAELQARLDVEGHGPVVLQDVFSGPGYMGGRAPQGLYNQVSALVHLLNANSFQPVRINRIECATTIRPGRSTAEIEAVELDSEAYAPGETVKATAFVRPFRGQPQRVHLSLKLPPDLPEGGYTVTVCDDLTNARHELRDNPTLNSPQNLEQVFAALKVQTEARRTNLVMRVPLGASGVALGGKALPDLPAGMVHVLGNSRRTGAQAMSGSLVARHKTDWVVQGAESVRFTVTRNKKAFAAP